LASEVVNFDALYDSVIKNLPVCLKVYENFEKTLQKDKNGHHDIDVLINSLNENLDKDVLKTMHIFNQSIVKTNFYNP